jgi:hypothetical protein
MRSLAMWAIGFAIAALILFVRAEFQGIGGGMMCAGPGIFSLFGALICGLIACASLLALLVRYLLSKRNRTT